MPFTWDDPKPLSYEEQLKDDRWKWKRMEILERDWHICQKCMSSRNLNVHHKWYEPGKMAWDYPNYALITWCESCHKEHHEKHGIVIGADPIIEKISKIKEWIADLKRLNNG
jgi:5-methylcytosine-specific restriction endonuclease McrA